MNLSELEKASVTYAIAYIKDKIIVIENWLDNPRGRNIEKDRENFKAQLVELNEDLIAFEKIASSFG